MYDPPGMMSKFSLLFKGVYVRRGSGVNHFWMLIKLRNEFYQVECDAFANLATELLDIRPNFRRAVTHLNDKT